MITRFDSLDRFEIPKIYICNPGCLYNNGLLTNVVGILSDTSDEELVVNFNELSELSFRANRVAYDDSEENEHNKKMFAALQARRLLYVDDIGFFSISSSKEGLDGGVRYKDVTAQSIESEIQNKLMPYIEDGTYKLGDMMDTILGSIPYWTVDNVDASLTTLYRTFEDVSVESNVYAFMIEEMQSAYECVFEFDTIHRKINIYDQNNYVHRTDIHITPDDLISELSVESGADDLYTAISVEGQEDLNIVAVNPLGTNVIYNFDYYLGWMTPALATKVAAWEALIANSQVSYSNLGKQYYGKLESKSGITSELSMIETRLTLYKRCAENIVASDSQENVASYNDEIEKAGGQEIDISVEKSDTLNAISNLIAAEEANKATKTAELATVNSELESLMSQMSAINTSVGFSTYFSANELAELTNYIFEGSYTDEYITIAESMTSVERVAQMQTLYDRAVAQLDRISKPTMEYDIDVENFIFVKDFQYWSDQLATGCIINVEIDENEVEQLFLTAITVNYDDSSLSLTFGNRLTKFGAKALFEDLLGNVSKTANSISFIKDALYPITSGEFNAMKEYLQTSKDLTKGAALAASNQSVVIDDTGYTGRRVDPQTGEIDSEQIKITGSNIVFTQDGWETASTAIGKIIVYDEDGNATTTYGINGQLIMGDVIVGEQLSIIDADGNDAFVAAEGRVTATIHNQYDTRLSMIDGSIQSTVNDINNLSRDVKGSDGAGGLAGRVSAVEQTADSLGVSITSLQNDKTASSVTTTTGFKFDESGLTISKTGYKMSTNIDEDGMDVISNDGDEQVKVLQADSTGVNALNLTARKYLVAGQHIRFEDYGDRAGCFWISNTYT